MATTKPEVFIIESLQLPDEEIDRFEGNRLADMLVLSDKKCKYFYIRTAIELTKIMEVFDESQYRYLHLSCHGLVNDSNDTVGLATTINHLEFD